MTDIVCYYLNKKAGWVVYAKDNIGNQIWDAEYFPNRKMLARSFGIA
jgi:hypothetical protein